MFLHNGYQSAAEKCCVPEHRENLNDWYVHKHDCRLLELTVHAYLGCFYACLPLVLREVFLCWRGALVRAWKINSTTTTVLTSCAYLWWMFSLHTLADEAKIPLLFFFARMWCRAYWRSSPTVHDAVGSSPLVVGRIERGTRPRFVFLLVRHKMHHTATDRTLRLRNCSWPPSQPCGRNLMPRPSYPGRNYGVGLLSDTVCSVWRLDFQSMKLTVTQIEATLSVVFTCSSWIRSSSLHRNWAL